MDSDNVAGSVRGTRKIENRYAEDRGLLRRTKPWTWQCTSLNPLPSTGWLRGTQVAVSLATRAVEKKYDVFFLNARWHTD